MVLTEPYERVRALLDDPSGLVRAIASGRRRGEPEPAYRRVELRYVDVRAGRVLQATGYDETRATTWNSDDAGRDDAIRALLADTYANWHVESTTSTLRLQVSRKGRVLCHEEELTGAARTQDTGHDRAKQRAADPQGAFLRAVGITDAEGRVKPTKVDKYAQIEQFVRILGPGLDAAVAAGRLDRDRPLRVTDLGCGNAYLTFAVAQYLRDQGWPADIVGIDVKAQARERNSALAEQLGWDEVRFDAGRIDAAEAVPGEVDVVLALHACDTATDDALAKAVDWRAPLILAAPCCHHDLQRQLAAAPAAPSPYGSLTRHGIVRERFADLLTDTLRAAVLRQHGYRVEVMEFVSSVHTPRNLLLRAVRTDAPPDAEQTAEYRTLCRDWSVRPRLAELLGDAVSVLEPAR